MGKPVNPKILNLDELEFQESDIEIVHEGQSHKMRVLTVDMFIAQNKRALEHQKLVESTVEDGDTPEIGDVVELMKNSIGEFFPTLPLGDLPTAKLFTIFAWLNKMSAELNATSADAVEDDEGNVPSPEAPTES